MKRITLDAKSLEAEAEKVIASGALGRSPAYANLLRYLVACANRGSHPKEIEIAIEVLGRDVDFDVAKDSAVRVYIHQLRKKLDRYYKEHEPDSPYRLAIPKGQYTVEVLETPPASGSVEGSPTATEDQENTARANGEAGKARNRLWLAAASLLLVANLFYLLAQGRWIDRSDGPAASAHPAWQALLDDDTPILVVMGDYYIFGELDEAGNVSRMIRDFHINSKEDLNNLFAEKPDLGWKYYDLNLSYLPEGSALALNNLFPVLYSGDKAVNVKMMSELNTRDLQSNHIVYIGYISGLDRISNLVFSVSHLRIGENYDQLIDEKSGTVYTSDAGLPSFNEPFTDYGWFATFPSTRKTRLVVVAGMRDAGLVQTAQAMTGAASLRSLTERLAQSKSKKSAAFEAVYRVRGLDRMNFDGQLEYASFLRVDNIWERELNVGSR